MKSFRKSVLLLALLTFAATTLLAQDQSQALNASSRPPQASVPKVPKPAPQRPTTFGTSAVSYIIVPAAEFRPHSNSSGYAYDDFGRGQLYPTGSPTDFSAAVHVPSGAQVVYMELDGTDSSATDYVLASLTYCDYPSTNCTYHPLVGSSIGNDCNIAGFICSGLANIDDRELVSVDLSSENIIADNFNNVITVLVEPSEATGLEKVGAVIIGYVLQVSAAPATASFNDVPTSDFAFQYIEALFASGVTGGCGANPPFVPPVYCPDAFVTRRQMGIFFAKALGLQWQ